MTSRSTDREEVTEQRRTSDRYQALVKATGNIVWTNSPDGEMRGPQPDWCAYTGQTEEEVQGYGWSNAVHADDAQPTIDAWRQAVAHRTMFVFEHRVRHHDGVFRWFGIRAVPVLDPDGSIREWVGLHRDIEDEKQASQAQREAAALLDRERNLLKLFVDHAPAQLAMFDREMRYLAVSRRWLSDFGLTTDVIGQVVYVAFTGLPERWREVHRRSLTGEVLSEEEDAFPRPDGHVQYLRWECRPWYEPDGSIGGIVIGSEDVTSRVESRRALESAREELNEFAERERAARLAAEEASRAKDDFLAMLGHELRNPLAPIATAVHLLKLRSKDTLSREVAVIERQSQHIARLVDDLLDVSRVASGKVVLNKAAAEVADLIAAAIETASPALENGIQTLVVNVPKHALVVDVDRGRMTQVLANLLTNAAKYTPSGGRIAITATREADEVVIAVEDTGVGISGELLPRVFDLFVQARQTLDRAQGGLGLGLALVKNLVAMHDGTVSAASPGLGHGSTFTVRLPRVEATATEERSSSPPIVASASHLQRVLIVDDNADGADMLAEALGSLGYRTAVAHDGPEALRVAGEFAPHVALLDIGLPVMDGFELAARLRAQWSDVKLVAITGYGQESDRQRTRGAGFQAHLTKPVDLENLANLLVELCRENIGGASRSAHD
ncbi:MAG: PAS domain S-box protein [Deltaproteobacteria bacterium]|nr:PAS domain S-box protein [Deltaproteobacteria bacterium]